NTISVTVLISSTGFPPGNVSISSNATNPDTNGIYSLNWVAVGADNYTLYESSSPIMAINGSQTAILIGTNATSTIMTKLSNGTWWYAVVAENGSGSTLSNTISVTVTISPPSPPKNVIITTNATNPDINGIYSLNWSAEGAINYTLYHYPFPITTINGSVTILAANLVNTSYIVYNSVNSTWWYAVVAENANGTTLSNTINVTVAISPPSPPKNVIISSDAMDPDIDGVFTLYWSADGADNYTLYEYSSPITSINGSLSILLQGTAETNLTITKLVNDTWWYAVVAENGLGSTLSNTINVTVEIPPPGPPENVIITTNATNPDTNGIFSLNWSADGADNYTLYEYSSPITSINGSLSILLQGTAETNLTITKLVNGTWWYAVVAENGSGSTLSNTLNVTVQLSQNGNPPYNVFLSTDAMDPDTDGIFLLNWSANDADNYTLYEYSSPITMENASLIVVGSGLTTLTRSILKKVAGTWWYAVVAVNRMGRNISNTIKVTVEFAPETFILTVVNNTVPDSDGVFGLVWTSSKFSDNYTVYMYSSQITEINGSLTVLTSETKDLSMEIKDLITTSGTYYFIVEAKNRVGETLSNCVSVRVVLSTEEPEPQPGVPGYDVSLLICSIALMAVIILMKKRKIMHVR
ncbi:MAG: hypothetical protein ACTSVI_04765, partial [Promethearchaeota archaeon]